ncbi:MAG: tetratricopeptide repeat protein [Pseudomonadota bacterium]
MEVHKVLGLLFRVCCLVAAMSAVAAPEQQVTVDLEALQRNAQAGDRVAQYNLGVVHETGRFGVPMDKAEAARWYRKSAEQGYENAQYNLGVLYLRGEGVEQDRAAALHWLGLAAEQLNPAAIAALEKLGVEKPDPAGQ